MRNWPLRVLSVLSLSILMVPSLVSAHEEHFYRHHISGCIENAVPFHLDLRGGPAVQLHQGTIIDPRGTTLRSDMRVGIEGYRDRNSDAFIADRIVVERDYCSEPYHRHEGEHRYRY